MPRKINQTKLFTLTGLFFIFSSIVLGGNYLYQLNQFNKIQSYHECIDKGFTREVTSPKSCKVGYRTFYDAKELIPESVIRYKLTQDDGKKDLNGFNKMSNEDCKIKINYNQAITNYAKNYTSTDKTFNQLKTSFNNRIIEGYGLVIQTPEVGKFNIICINKQSFVTSSLNPSNFKKGGYENLYFLNSNELLKVDAENIFIEDRYNNGQINWYLTIGDKAYFVSDWKNLIEKANIKIELTES